MVDMDTDLMDMERETLSLVMDMESVTVLLLLLTILMEVPALPTDPPRVFPDTDMVVTDMERDLPSQDTAMEVDTLMSTKAVHTTMDLMDITSTILMERDPLSQATELPSSDTVDLLPASTSPDHTPATESMLLTHTKERLSEKNVPSNK